MNKNFAMMAGAAAVGGLVAGASIPAISAKLSTAPAGSPPAVSWYVPGTVAIVGGAVLMVLGSKGVQGKPLTMAATAIGAGMMGVGGMFGYLGYKGAQKQASPA